MRYLSAIFFLSLFLFQLFSYSLVFRQWEQKEEAQFLTQIYDNQQNEALLSVKVAVQLPPYTIASEAFEWASGEIVLDGVGYKYVKKRIIGDSLEFLCTPDVATAKLQSARELFFQLCQDLQDSEEGNKRGNIKPLFPDCYSHSEELSGEEVLTIFRTLSTLPAPSFIQSLNRAPSGQPPDAIPC